MACYHPARAVRLQSGDVKFVSASVVDGSSFTLPCRQCVGCKLERSRQWAIRCLDEKSMHDESSFLTVTMSPESVAKYGRSLDVRMFQLFMKRFRKEISPKRIRVFYCGEYTQSFMPHYHALVFGHSFSDRKFWSMNKAGTDKLFRSASLERLWPHGFSMVGDVSFESAAYIARYTLKKVNGSRDDQDRLVIKSTGEILRKEFIAMSRGGRGGLGGIGTSWFKKFSSDVYPSGNRVIRGRDMRPPVFYDTLYSELDPIGFEDLKFRRSELLDKSDNIEYRLRAKEEVAIARVKLLPRGMENDL